MGLTILRAVPSDAPTSTAIENAAYGGGPLSGILFPGPFPSDDKPDSRTTILEQEIMNEKTMRFMKAVDSELEEQGKNGTVAFAKWFVKEADWWEKEQEKGVTKRNYGQGANEEACEILFGGMREAYIERWKGKPHLYLKNVHTSPNHQGRGAGSMLLKALTEEADHLGLPAYLEATDAGKRLYLKFGFRDVGTTSGDYSKWGGPKEHLNYLMLREPVKTE